MSKTRCCVLKSLLTRRQFIVMFRSRFTEAFQKSLPNFGPQELERDVVSNPPGEAAEHFLCALLGLLLNRKQDVKYVAQEPVLGNCLKIQMLTSSTNTELVTIIAH